MKFLAPVVLLLGVVVYQSLFSELFSIAEIKPDLALALTAYLALVRGPEAGLAFGFFSGLCLDVLSPLSLGTGMFIRALIGYLVGNFKDHLFLDTLSAKGTVVALASLVAGLFQAFWTSGPRVGHVLWFLWRYGFLIALYTGLLGIFIFAVAEGKVRLKPKTT